MCCFGFILFLVVWECRLQGNFALILLSIFFYRVLDLFPRILLYLSNWWNVEIIGNPLTGKSLYELDGVGHGWVSV